MTQKLFNFFYLVKKERNERPTICLSRPSKAFFGKILSAITSLPPCNLFKMQPMNY